MCVGTGRQTLRTLLVHVRQRLALWNARRAMLLSAIRTAEAASAREGGCCVRMFTSSRTLEIEFALCVCIHRARGRSSQGASVKRVVH